MTKDLIQRLKEICKSTYSKSVRKILPRNPVYYNDVPISNGKYFDRTINKLIEQEDIPADRPNYESGIVNSLREYVKPGQDLVIVGGGWGVTSVIAADLVGSSGTVRVFEAGSETVNNVRETLELNSVSSTVDVQHAIVGEPVAIPEDTNDADRITPRDIPECDVLELDCEGSEISILSSIDIRPEIIIVETHGLYNSPTQEVAKLLKSKSYEVVEKRIADVDHKQFCEENDIYVLVALNKLRDSS